MVGSLEPVSFLRVLLPRLGPLQENGELLRTSGLSRVDQMRAALSVLQDLCACFVSFQDIELPDVVGKRQRIVFDHGGDTAWLATVGLSLDRVLVDVGLEWPPPGQIPPAIVQSLQAMYSRGTARDGTYPPFSARRLRDALQPVGAQACTLAASWPFDDDLSDEGLARGFALANRTHSLPERLGLLANIAQALTLPAALLAVGTDSSALVGHLHAATQVVGHDVIGMTLEISRELGPLQIGPRQVARSLRRERKGPSIGFP